MVIALFAEESVQDPSKEPIVIAGVAAGGTKGPPMRTVEKCLIAKMRIHRGY